MSRRFFVLSFLLIIGGSFLLTVLIDRLAFLPSPHRQSQLAEVGLGAGASQQIWLGQYDGGWSTTGGQFDPGFTLSRLQEAHVNIYAMLLKDSPSVVFNNFKLLLQYLAAENITLYVTLMPPENNGCVAVQPHGCNIKAWGEELARLSLTYPHLRGWIIDDFYYSSLFTPAYLSEITQAARAINSDFKLFATAYTANLINTEFVAERLSFVDGIIFPFFSLFPSCNLSQTAELGDLIELFNHLYRDQDWQTLAIKYPADTTSQINEAGTFVLTKQLTDADDLSFSFAVGNVNPLSTTGYHFAQFLVNDAVLWEKDLAEIGRGGLSSVVETVTIPDTWLGQNVQLQLRVVEKKAVNNYPVQFNFFTPQDNWQLMTTGAFSGKIWSLSAGKKLLVTMVYASNLTNCPPDPSSQYIETATKIALDRAADGQSDGVIQYLLNFRDTSPSGEFARIKNLYTQFASSLDPGDDDDDDDDDDDNNETPEVDAGANQASSALSGISLEGRASDDGLPAGSTLQIVWEKISGPGTVSFANPNSLTTTVSFSKTGVYVLRLTATDGALSDSDRVSVAVGGETITTYTLPDETALATTGGRVTISPKKNEYEAGEAVVFTAIPDAGYSFVSWSGDINSASNPLTLTVGSFQALRANFALIGAGTLPLNPSASFPPLTDKFALGQRGAHVIQLQKMLAADNLFSGEATGYYGPETKAAVAAFQQKYGIVTTADTLGLAGPATRAKLNALFAGGAAGGQVAALRAQLLLLLQQLYQLLLQKVNASL